MASSSSNLGAAYMHAAVAFTKVAGSLAAHHSNSLSWTPSSSSSSVAPFTIRFADIAGLQTSKQGAAQTALMIALANGAQVAGKSKVLLVFNAAPATALEDREKFKNELANAVAANRARQQAESGSATPSSTAPASPAAAAVAATARSSTPSSPAPTTTRGGTPDVTRSSTPATATATATATAAQQKQRGGQDARAPPKTEMELRISILRSNPHLRSLHKDVVLSGAMQDSEFWSHPQRQALIRAERAMLEQRQGRNARLADPKPTPNEAGEMKLSITSELIRDLFEQFPVVARAYEENVPDKLDESAFWTRYFQSKLYHRLRTSARSAASEHIVQDDPIFDKYLEDEDDQLEPRRLHNPHDRLLDLAATEEDHQETGNSKDWTMRAGAERKTLPLMRRFNDHSQSLLDSALGEQEAAVAAAARRIVGGVGEEYAPAAGSSSAAVEDPSRQTEDTERIKARYYREIEIDDLNESEKTERVRLNVGLEGYMGGSGGGGAETTTTTTTDATMKEGGEMAGRKRKRATDDDGSVPKTLEEILSTVSRFEEGLEGWMPDLGEYKVRKGESEVAMKVMLANVRGRTTGRGGNDLKTLPDSIQKSTTSIQASTTEFLRQLWSCISTSPLSSAAGVGGEGATWKDIQSASTSASRGGVDNARGEDETTKRERAKKMKASLEKQLEKMRGIEVEAEEEGGEEARRKVVMALEPTKAAVRRGLAIPL